MLSFLLGILASILAAEIYFYLPSWAERLVIRHASRLPEHLQARMLEEWKSLLTDTKGHFSKLVIAVDLYRARWSIQQDHSSWRGIFFRNRYMLLADFAFVCLAATSAVVLRFGWPAVRLTPMNEASTFLITAALTKPLVMFLFGMYRRYWKYAGIVDIAALVMTVLASSILVVLTTAFLSSFSSPLVAMADFMFFLTLAVLLRVSVRAVAMSAIR